MADEEVIIQLVLDKKDAEKVLAALPKDAVKSGKKSGKQYTKGLGQGIDSGVGGLKKSLSGLSGVLAGVTAAFGAALTIRQFTQAAIRQEDAVNKLEASLRRIGESSSDTSSNLQSFASSLQETTRFGDEAIIENLAFAQSLGASAEQSRQVVAASADLAAALGIDLQSAVRNVGKTLGGYAGELGEVLPELKNLSQEQLRAGEGVKLLAQQFSGFAQDEAQTFGGSLDQLSNTVGDLFEEFGRFITRSETSAGALDNLKEALQGVQTFARDIRLEIQEPTEIEDVRAKLQSVKAEIIDLEQLQRNAASQSGNRFANVNENLGEKIRELRLEQTQLETKIKDVEITEKQALKRKEDLAIANDNQAKSLANLSAEQQRLRDQALEVKTTIDPIKQRENELQAQNEILMKAKEQELITLEDFKVREAALNQQFEQLDGDRASRRLDRELFVNESISESVARVGEAFKQTAKDASVSAKDIAKLSTNVIARGVGSAFQSVGKALAEGANGFDAFKKGLENTLADIASSIGDLFIEWGVGNIASLNFGVGAAQIAAGGALKVLAGSLGGGGGGVGAASGTTAPAGSPRFDFDTGADLNDPLRDQERQTQNSVNVNVQGDVLDSDETGLRIVELINQGLERDGAIVVRET